MVLPPEALSNQCTGWCCNRPVEFAAVTRDISKQRRLCQICFLSALLLHFKECSLFVVFFGPVDDHGSPVSFRSVFSPTHTSLRSQLQTTITRSNSLSRGSGDAPFMWTAFLFHAMSGTEAVPACEPNLTQSCIFPAVPPHPVQRTAQSAGHKLPLAMFFADVSPDAHTDAPVHIANAPPACAASPSKKRNSELPFWLDVA